MEQLVDLQSEARALRYPDSLEPKSGLRQWGEPDVGAAPLLFVGPQDDFAALDAVAGVRLAAAVAAVQAPGWIRQMARVDIVWLAASEAIENELLTELCAAAAARGCRLVCETTIAALDRVVALVPDALRAEFLVDADAADRLAAIAAVRAPRQLVVCDVARDAAMERIDRLQEEVARISRLLGDLASQGGLSGTPGAVSSASHEEFGAFAGGVRSPLRDFAAMPRSFVPEDRALDRQRAKMVRRMIRQRRMREQYFPADLFADPAWDMLLDLYAARLERQPVSVSSLCIAAAVPATTALRWIKTMTDAGLFLRDADPDDGRRIFIALAEGAFDAMTRYFEALDE